MSVDYDLQISTGGYVANSLADIIAQVSGAIGLYPGYTYQNTTIEQTASGDIVHILYSDDNATSAAQAEVIPLIVYAVLAAIVALGIAYVAYAVFVIAPSNPWGQVAIIAGVVTSVALLITAMKKKSSED